MPTTGEMIKELLKVKGLKQTDLARRVGVRPSSVNQWISGRSRIDPTNLQKVATALDVSIDELLGGAKQELSADKSALTHEKTNVRRIKAPDPSMFVEVPFLSAKAQAGPPRIVLTDCQPDTGEMHLVLSELIDVRYRYLVLEIDGYSMEPELRNGSRVLARMVSKDQYTYESGGVYAVLYADRLVVKRIRTNDLRESKKLTLVSDNDQYGQLTIDAADIQCVWRILYNIYQPVR